MELIESDRKRLANLFARLAESGSEAQAAAIHISAMANRLGITGGELQQLVLQGSSTRAPPPPPPQPQPPSVNRAHQKSRQNVGGDGYVWSSGNTTKRDHVEGRFIQLRMVRFFGLIFLIPWSVFSAWLSNILGGIVESRSIGILYFIVLSAPGLFLFGVALAINSALEYYRWGVERNGVRPMVFLTTLVLKLLFPGDASDLAAIRQRAMQFYSLCLGLLVLDILILALGLHSKAGFLILPSLFALPYLTAFHDLPRLRRSVFGEA